MLDIVAASRCVLFQDCFRTTPPRVTEPLNYSNFVAVAVIKIQSFTNKPGSLVALIAKGRTSVRLKHSPQFPFNGTTTTSEEKRALPTFPPCDSLWDFPAFLSLLSQNRTRFPIVLSEKYPEWGIPPLRLLTLLARQKCFLCFRLTLQLKFRISLTWLGWNSSSFVGSILMQVSVGRASSSHQQLRAFVFCRRETAVFSVLHI